MVKLNDTATASTGTPQCPATGKSRSVPGVIDGGPNGAGNPTSERVSARRHGVRAMNGSGVAATSAASADFVESCAEPVALCACGCQNGGADQFRTAISGAS